MNITFKSPFDWAYIRTLTFQKSGVYILTNNINGKFYIGSAVCLYSRLRDYHQDWYQASRSNTLIVRAMQKYGSENFTIGILEFTDKLGASEAEQKWIDSLKPEYNLLQKASSSLGYTHKAEDIVKISEAMTGKPRSDEVRMAMSARQMGSNNTFYGKTHTDSAKQLVREAALARTKSHKPAFAVEVLDTVTGVKESFSSIRAVTRRFNCSITTVNKHDGLLYKDRYLINISRPVKD